MSVTTIVGLQWGDEGKGRVSHFVSNNAICIRSTGGNNAGHTVVVNGKKYVLHLLPSSIIKPGTFNIIAPGVVVDLEVLCGEIRQLQDAGISITTHNLCISPRAHIIMPYHIELDKLHEIMKGANKVGTTLRGIGPCYADKINRIGFQMNELVNSPASTLLQKLNQVLHVHNQQLSSAESDLKNFQAKSILKDYLLKNKDFLKPFVSDEHSIIFQALKRNDKIVLEGAQSIFLDIDQGDYPFVTSSSPSASGTLAGAGIGPSYSTDVYGVMKAYCSRVGEGPFNTEQDNEVGELIRKLGHEYGSTTNRPRRCGWLDLVRLHHAVKVNGVTALCLNHLDTIGKVGQELGYINVCISYRHKHNPCQVVSSYVPINSADYLPCYKVFKGGWDTTGCTTYESLPDSAKEYIKFIEKYSGAHVKFIGIGPDEKDTIIR